MRRISSLIVPNAIVVVAVVSATAISVGIGNAQAEGNAQAADCLAAPNAASPAGQHWYYRIDRATGRHCWYLHTVQRIAHQAHHASVLTNETIEHPAPAAPVAAAATLWPAAVAPIPDAAAPMPAAAPPMPVADQLPAADQAVPVSASAADDAPSPPHVTVLAVKTIPVRQPGAQAQTRSGHDADGASISEASARAVSVAPESKTDSTTFFYLVFGLGLVTFLMAIVVKRVAPQARWFFWPIRTEAGMVWPQEQPDYLDDEPVRWGSRVVIDSRRTNRRVLKTDHYADETAEAEYERA